MIIWITGASSGLGKELARQYALLGHRVCASARNAAYREKQKNPEFNYGAVEYGEDADEWERTESGQMRRNGRRVYGRLWRVDPENDVDSENE